jgi:hypothetical protein
MLDCVPGARDPMPNRCARLTADLTGPVGHKCCSGLGPAESRPQLLFLSGFFNDSLPTLPPAEQLAVLWADGAPRCAPQGRRPNGRRTKIVRGWPKLWANFGALMGTFSQSSGPSLAIRANPVHFC